MGIRFFCPNGHKLNVKSDLAGRRALCPECGAKLVVPEIAGAHAAATPGKSSSAELPLAMPSGVIALGPTVAPAAPVPATSIAPASVWYLRPKSGGQYGPATDEIFSQWIREGRVAADAYVWRDSWTDWRLARDASGELPAPLESLSAPTGSAGAWPVAGPSISQPAEPPQVAATPSDVPEVGDGAIQPASHYLALRKRANQRQMTIAIVMLVAIVILTGILAWVLLSGGSPAKSARAGSRGARSTQLAGSAATTYVAGLDDRRFPSLHGMSAS